MISLSVHDNCDLDDTKKLTYLREAIKDREVTPLLYRATETKGQYQELITILKDRYDQWHLIHQTHTMAIVNAPMIKHGSHAELCSFIENLEHNMSCLTDSGQHTFEAVWTSIVAGKLSKKLEEEWLKYSDEENYVPDIKTLVTFLKKQLLYLPKTKTAHAQPKVEVKTEPSHKLYKFPVHQIAPWTETHTTCSLCGGERHPIYVFSSYKALDQDKIYRHIRDIKLCFNCLYPGHSTKDCLSSGRCHTCSKMHHTSLHREYQTTVATTQSSLVQSTSKKLSTAFSVNASFNPVEPTLQMTSQVILEAPDGKRLLVRA